MTSVESTTEPSAFERRRYLDDMVALLWPASPPGDQVTAGVPTEYVLVPNGRRPTLMLPRRPARVAAELIRNYKTSADQRSQLKFTALGVAARAGATALLPERVTVLSWPGSGDGDITAYLSTALGQPVLLGLHTSPPRANRKPILHLLTPSGASVGFAKVGVDRLTRELVSHEASTLQLLAAARFHSFEAPELLHYGTWNGLEIVVQSPLLRGDRNARPQRLHEAMRELATIRPLERQPVEGTGYVSELRTKVSALAPSPARGAFLSALDELAARSSQASGVLVGAWHGDWTPWNMTAYADRLAVWDWERFAHGVPAGYDALHFEMQSAIQRRRVPARRAAEETLASAPTLLGGFGLDEHAAREVALLYLVEIGARYVGDDQAGAGARLGKVDEWLVPVLASALSEHTHKRAG